MASLVPLSTGNKGDGTTSTEKKKSSKLNDLVQTSRNLPKRLDDIETLHLSLNEIQKRAYNLRHYNKPNTETNLFTKAHYLLIGKGITIEDIEDDLNSLDSLIKSNEYNKSLHKKSKYSDKDDLLKPSNLVHYMNRQKDEDVISTIENSLTAAAKDFDNFVNNNIDLDWKHKKKELYEKLHTVIKREPSGAITTSSPEKKIKKYSQKELLERQLTWGVKHSKSLISSIFNFDDISNTTSESAINPNVSYSLRKKFEIFAEVIYELNEARQSNSWYKLATVISSIYKSEINGNKSDQLHEAYVILREFCEAPEDSNDEGDQVDDNDRPSRFRKATNSKLTDIESIKLRERIVLKSREYLETQFRDYINELYIMNKSTNLNEISAKNEDKFLIPNVDRVINYIELTMRNKQKQWKIPNMTFINGLPLWAILFYLLRSGCYNEAIILISKYEDSFQKLEKSFPYYLKSYCESKDKKLSEELQGRLQNEFNQYFKNSNQDIDPFRYAVYKIIGKCDTAKKNLDNIQLSIEDWLWLHLTLIKEHEEDDIMNDNYRLVDLQKTVVEFGSESFNISSKNPMYLQTLLLVGLFEDAIKYWMQINEIDAIHLAVVLNYYGLIRISDVSKTSLLNINSYGFKSINFGRMIGNYVKKFKFSDPRVASEYLFLLSINEDQLQICQDSIRELVLETREYILLLGKITSDGVRIPGVIEERKSLLGLKDEKSYLYNITEKAAQIANEEGRLFDCILLYQLSEEYDIVLKIINKLLGDFLNSIDLVNHRGDLLNDDNVGDINIVRLSENILKIYNSSPEILSQVAIQSRLNCEKLLDIYRIFRVFNEGKDYNKLLNEIKALELIPISADISLSEIRRYLTEFEKLDENLMKNVPNLLIVEMMSLRELLSISDNSAKDEELKKIAKNSMIFAGLIKYKMPREIYTILINFEISL
ncbi:unnamed protein product [Pichia kudriavzevii]